MGKNRRHQKLALFPLPGHEVVRAPKTEGRSRFSRPALRLLRSLILSGEKPSVFHQRLLDRDPSLLDEIGMDILDAEPVRIANGAKNFTKQPRPWVLASQLKFLADLARTNDSWEGLYIPEQRLDSLEARHSDVHGNVARDAAIRELIGSVNDPVVRHRLGVFAERLAALQKEFGQPEEIVMEFIRTDFMGDKAKAQLAAFQKKREEARSAAVQQVGKTDAIKYELAAAQGCSCIYCGAGTGMTGLDSFEVEHIVPRSQGGPDAMVNYALACRSCNEKKGERTPFQWLRLGESWDAFETRVHSRSTDLRNKKSNFSCVKTRQTSCNATLHWPKRLGFHDSHRKSSGFTSVGAMASMARAKSGSPSFQVVSPVGSVGNFDSIAFSTLAPRARTRLRGRPRRMSQKIEVMTATTRWMPC